MNVTSVLDKISRLGRTIKWVIIVIVLIIVIYVIIRMKKLKPEIENMLKDEFRIAGHIFSLRDALHDNKKAKIDKPDVKEEEKKEEEKEREAEEEDEKHVGRTGVRRSGSKTSNYKREEICRKILEEYFDDYFPTVRPKFLANPETGYPLELDGYNARLNLAFEHNGKQHYTYPNYFHKTKDEFEKQVRRDQWKHQRCIELGISVIIIPYHVPEKDIEDFILLEVKKLKIK